MATINGEVTGHYASGIYVRDDDGGVRWQLWMDERPAVGTRGTAKGKPGAKDGKPWTGRDGKERKGFDLMLNDVVFTVDAQVMEAAPEITSDQWGTSSTDTPF
jgi:hypothetical protein